MQSTTEPTSKNIDSIKLEENEILTEKSSMSKWNNSLEFSPLKSTVVFFLVIMIYVIACEAIQHSFIELQNILEHEKANSHRLLKCLWYIAIIFVGVIAIYCLIIFIGGLVLYIADNFIPLCIKYWYVEGKQSYKWWQKKSVITLIIRSFAVLSWMTFVIVLVPLLLYHCSWDDPNNDRSITYRITALLILILLTIAFIAGIIFRKDPLYSKIKPVKVQ